MLPARETEGGDREGAGVGRADRQMHSQLAAHTHLQLHLQRLCGISFLFALQQWQVASGKLQAAGCKPQAAAAS